MSSPRPTTETIVRRILQTVSAEVAATEPAALGDDPQGVHRHRTSVRRARAVLAGLRAIADPSDVDPLRAALAEWGRQLGEVRDAQVRADLAEGALDAAGADDPDARRRLVDDERAEYTRLHARLVELSATPRARERGQLLRLSGLEVRVRDPDTPADEVFAALLRREARRVHRARKTAPGSAAQRHALRKAARRLRYLADAVQQADPELVGKAPKRLAKAGRRIQDALGDERDLTMLVRHLEAARGRAAHAGEPLGAYDDALAATRERVARSGHDVPRALGKIHEVAEKLR